MYDLDEKEWFSLPELPYCNSSLVTIPDRNHLLAIGGCKVTNKTTEMTTNVLLWDDENKKWLHRKYPSLLTARSNSSVIYHRSSTTVVAAGGVTCYNPWTMTRTVEVLHIIEGWFSEFRTHWIKVEQLPHVVYDAVPLIINENLYIAGGFDKYRHSTYSIVTASLPGLLESNSYNTSESEVWNKLPDMPCFSSSINHFQGHLITFTGLSLDFQPDKDKPVQSFHFYNQNSESWDCVQTISSEYAYIWGRSIHLRDNAIFVIGGTTNTAKLYPDKNDDLVTKCMMIEFTKTLATAN